MCLSRFEYTRGGSRGEEERRKGGAGWLGVDVEKRGQTFVVVATGDERNAADKMSKCLARNGDGDG